RLEELDHHRLGFPSDRLEGLGELTRGDPCRQAIGLTCHLDALAFTASKRKPHHTQLSRRRPGGSSSKQPGQRGRSRAGAAGFCLPPASCPSLALRRLPSAAKVRTRASRSFRRSSSSAMRAASRSSHSSSLDVGWRGIVLEECHAIRKTRKNVPRRKSRGKGGGQLCA